MPGTSNLFFVEILIFFERQHKTHPVPKLHRTDSNKSEWYNLNYLCKYNNYTYVLNTYQYKVYEETLRYS